METLNAFRERLRAFYAEYTVYVDILGKFILAFVCLYWIGQVFGGRGVLANIFVVVFVSLILSLMPVRTTTIVSSLFIIGHSLSIGLDAAALTGVVLLILVLLFLIYVPDDAHALIFMPMAMFFGIPVLVPIAWGLRRRPASILAVGSGVVVYHLLGVLVKCADLPPVESMSGYVERLATIAGRFIGNTNMAADAMAACLTLIIVYAIRNLDADYVFEAAIVCGAAVYAAVLFFANTAVGGSLNVFGTVFGSVLSAVIMLAVNYFFFRLDYKSSERLVFEDDKYYYYVKAIPKFDPLARAAKEEEDPAAGAGPDGEGGEEGQ